MSNESDATSLRMKVQAFLSRDTKMRLQHHEDLDNYVYEHARHSDHLNVPQAVVDLMEPVFLSLVTRYNPDFSTEATRADAEQLLARFMLFLKNDENWSGWSDTDSSLENLLYNMDDIEPIPEPVKQAHEPSADESPVSAWRMPGPSRMKNAAYAVLALLVLGSLFASGYYTFKNWPPYALNTGVPAAVQPAQPDPGKISAVPKPAAPAKLAQPAVTPEQKPSSVPAVTATQLTEAQSQIKALEERVKKLESAQRRTTRASTVSTTKSTKRTAKRGGTKMAASVKGCVPYVINAFKGQKPQSGYICP